MALRRITGSTVRTICNLKVREGQEKFVAPNAVSIAQAYFTKSAWFRAIYAGETPVGFVMLAEPPRTGKHYLWRFMIDGNYQGRGHGGKALALVIRHVKKDPMARTLQLHVVRGEGSAEGLYSRFGFKFTGRVEHGEHEMRLDFIRPTLA